VVGGVGFIVSSWLFMLETQPTWYTPAPKVLGWHIGFWNLIGAFGFTICGALGFASENEAASYGSSLSTFIGSLAFLVRSLAPVSYCLEVAQRPFLYGMEVILTACHSWAASFNCTRVLANTRFL